MNSGINIPSENYAQNKDGQRTLLTLALVPKTTSLSVTATVSRTFLLPTLSVSRPDICLLSDLN